MPLILASGALSIVRRIGERASLTKLAKLVKDCCKWLVGILTTVYVGIISLQGLTAGSFDGVSVRTAKYALNNFVPVAGRMVADTVDTVLGCSLLIKNALGVTSIVITALILLTPLLTILGGMFAFRLAAAISEPVAMDRLPAMMGGVADVLGMLFGAVLAVGAMFMVTVGLLISAGNAAVMLR
jgi:stage III sporulation protein AE